MITQPDLGGANPSVQQLRFRTVVFDLDGTLADTAPDLTAALNHSLATLGRPPIDPASVRAVVGHGARALLQKGLAATGRSDEKLVEAGLPTFMRFYEENICNLTRPFDGTDQALDQLCGFGIKLAICTNKPAKMTACLLEEFGWQHRFSSVISGDSLSVRKPKPLPLQTAVRLAGGSPSAFVGDSAVDVETAAAAAVPCVAVSFGFSDVPVNQLGADAVIDSFSGLVAALGRL